MNKSSLRNDKRPPVRDIELQVQTWRPGEVGYAVNFSRWDFSKRRPYGRIRFTSSFYCHPTTASVRRVRRAQRWLLKKGNTARTQPQLSVGSIATNELSQTSRHLAMSK